LKDPPAICTHQVEGNCFRTVEILSVCGAPCIHRNKLLLATDIYMS
jgi:hypothetical protein